MNPFFLLSIIIITSCSSSNRLAKETNHIYGDDFFTALASGYKELSMKEKEIYDWRDAEEFAEKGLAALQKRYIPPENPLLREIPDNFVLDELILARNKMIIIFQDNTKFLFPLKSARLQVLYDYWVEEAEEDWQNGKMTRYRIEFWNTYNALLTAKRLAKRQDSFKTKHLYYIVNFDFDKYNIDKLANEILNQMTYTLATLDTYSIILEGHTDLSGTKGYNHILAKKRVKAVRTALIKKGIPKEFFIREEIHSSNKPKLSKAAGGYIDRLNRRVEIFVIPRKFKDKKPSRYKIQNGGPTDISIPSKNRNIYKTY